MHRIVPWLATDGGGEEVEAEDVDGGHAETGGPRLPGGDVRLEDDGGRVEEEAVEPQREEGEGASFAAAVVDFCWRSHGWLCVWVWNGCVWMGEWVSVAVMCRCVSVGGFIQRFGTELGDGRCLALGASCG